MWTIFNPLIIHKSIEGTCNIITLYFRRLSFQILRMRKMKEKKRQRKPNKNKTLLIIHDKIHFMFAYIISHFPHSVTGFFSFLFSLFFYLISFFYENFIISLHYNRKKRTLFAKNNNDDGKDDRVLRTRKKSPPVFLEDENVLCR